MKVVMEGGREGEKERRKGPLDSMWQKNGFQTSEYVLYNVDSWPQLPRNFDSVKSIFSTRLPGDFDLGRPQTSCWEMLL